MAERDLPSKTARRTLSSRLPESSGPAINSRPFWKSRIALNLRAEAAAGQLSFPLVERRALTMSSVAGKLK